MKHLTHIKFLTLVLLFSFLSFQGFATDYNSDATISTNTSDNININAGTLTIASGITYTTNYINASGGNLLIKSGATVTVIT